MTNEKRTIHIGQEYHKIAKIKAVEKNIQLGEYIEILIEKDNKRIENKK